MAGAAQMTLPQELFEDYNVYRQRTANAQAIQLRGGFALSPLKAKPKHLAALQRMAEWCVDRNIDPELWLYTLFVAQHWLYAPRFNCLTPTKHLARYQEFTKLGFYEARKRGKRAAARQAVAFDPNVDVSPSVEAVKASMLRMGDAAGCMAAMQAGTLGYHPKSRVCAGCPERQRCADALLDAVPFDIIALRHGHITREAAQAQARDHWEQRLVDPLVEERFGHGG